MSLFALSFLIGLLTAQTRSGVAVVLAAFGFALVLVSAVIALGTFSWAIVGSLALAILAFNAGLFVSLFGAVLLPTNKKSA